MDPLTRYVWLFVRGQESIRITRDRTELGLFVYGPAAAEQVRTFESVDGLKEYMEGLTQELQAERWTLHATLDRRGSRAEGGDAAARERRRPREAAVSEKDEPT